MDAVFVRDSSSLFPMETTRKSFYCPTPSKQPTSSKKNAAGMLNPPPTLTPPLVTPHTSSDMHWDLKSSSSVLKDTASTDTSGSSKFNESWPSSSDVADLLTHSHSHTFTNQMENHQPHQREPLTEHMKTPSQDQPRPVLTLAKCVERFRQAPPTSRGVRSKLADSFWWKSGEQHSSLTTPPQDQSTPNEKSHSFTDPSPHVSSRDSSLEERSHDLLEKSVSLMNSTDSSLPARKYLNTKRENNNHINIQQSLAPPTLPDPSEDILYVWRVKRRLEVARKEVELCTADRNAQLVTREAKTAVPPHQHWTCDILHCSCDPTGVPDSTVKPVVSPLTHSGVPQRTIAVQSTHQVGVQSTNQPVDQNRVRVQSKEVGVQYEATSDNETLLASLPVSGFHCDEIISKKKNESSPNKEKTGCHGIQVLDTSDEDDLSLTVHSEPAESPWQPLSTQIPSITPLLSQAVGEHLFKPHPSDTPTKVREASISPPAQQPSPDIPWDDHLNDDLLKTLVSRAKLFEAQIREIDLLLSALDGAD